jgi:hypothetical protein
LCPLALTPSPAGQHLLNAPRPLKNLVKLPAPVLEFWQLLAIPNWLSTGEGMFMRDTCILAAATLCISLAVAAATGVRGADHAAVRPSTQAHAHNDYLHARPLLDALEHGFTSVEADIFLVDGQLLVAHAKADLKPDRTLQALYLDPLFKRVRANGRVVAGGGPFQLLIDIKSAAEPTYAALAKVLAEYAEMISVVRDGKLEAKAVNVVISGNRPRAMMTGETIRYAGIDGRLGDLDSDLPAHLLPLVSDRWGQYFQWKGQGPMSEKDRQRLTEAVAKAHARGRQIRFWETPENVAAWRELRASGVDWINTDDLAGLEKFLAGAATSND